LSPVGVLVMSRVLILTQVWQPVFLVIGQASRRCGNVTQMRKDGLGDVAEGRDLLG